MTDNEFNKYRIKKLGLKFHKELLETKKGMEKEQELLNEIESEESPDGGGVCLEGSYAEDKFTEKDSSFYYKKH